MKPKKIIYLVLFGISMLGIAAFGFGIINTMVSIKYETESPKDCISLVTGDNLCLKINVLQILLVSCFATTTLLSIFRKRF